MLLAGALALVTVAGCGADAVGSQPNRPSGRAEAGAPLPRSLDANTINFAGLRDIELGASLRELSAAGAVATEGPACGPTFTTISAASPVFDGDRLVLIWAHAPLHTPEGVMVGSSVAEVRQAYPSAVPLTPPPGSSTFPGLLVTGGGDRAYLLLHADGQVQKLIVGLERYVRFRFDRGFGTC